MKPKTRRLFLTVVAAVVAIMMIITTVAVAIPSFYNY